MDVFPNIRTMDENGTIVDSFHYDAYGTLRGSSNEKEFPYLYASYRYDLTTGLYHTRAREYHPDLGRWIQRDPAGYADGPNLYQYGLSSPLTYVDPQ